MSSELNQPVTALSGVGGALANKLSRLGITTIANLLNHFPRRHEDFSRIIPIRSMHPGPVTFRGEIVQIASRRAHRNRRLSLTEAVLSDDTGTVKAMWFNQPYLAAAFPPGSRVLISGNLEFKNNDLALRSPAIEAVSEDPKDTARIIPVYPETEGLTSKQLRGMVKQCLPAAELIEETLPSEVLAKANLLPLKTAIRQIHFPDSQADLEAARRRLIFEEFWYLIITGLVIKQELKTEPAPQIKFNLELAQEYVKALDFSLTDAQRAAAWQILQDMEREHPMNRLLEGDVGSGKTVVAVLAAVMAASSGYQTALMVPTEILARQHAANFAPLLAKLNLRVVTLLGRQKPAEKGLAKTAAEDGSADLIIGTHALLSSGVEFKNLGLAVIDEQHRFGVVQRQRLKTKARRLPHLLSMTATPIPRSLALTVYGDLDLSIIDQLPPGRLPVKTKVAQTTQRANIYAEIDQQIGRGRQVYVICPLIEDSDILGYRSARSEAERLQKSVFKHRRIALLHGRLSPAEKDAVMTKFNHGEVDILVSTTVVEVGIDVPNATVMLIEGADRFGLATLHQLRGRVGRGAAQAFCYLISDRGATERLRALERTNDGFRLAQIDLEIRGPGQIYGLSQHGLLDLRLADITDTRLIAQVKALASDFLQGKGVLVKYPQMLDKINNLKAVTTLD